MLLRLAVGLKHAGFEVHVISLTSIGSVGRQMVDYGIAVSALGVSPSVFGVMYGVAALVLRIRNLRPDVVQTWMYHADLIGGVAARLARVRQVLWGIRQSDLDPETSKRTTIAVARWCARLSRIVPDVIVCCSQASVDSHRRLGYSVDRMLYVPNGFDVDGLKPDARERERFRGALGIALNAIAIGNLSRYDPQKDLGTFLRAAAIFSEHRRDAIFILAGVGVDQANHELRAEIDAAGLAGRVFLLGELEDVTPVLQALDILTLSSAYGEGFPNVIAEAMLCGVPCVATKVGDSAAIIGPYGRVVPIRDPAAIAGAWNELLDLDADSLARMKSSGRERIASRYALNAVVSQYAALYGSTRKCDPCAE